jgi:hypothetical protein
VLRVAQERAKLVREDILVSIFSGCSNKINEVASTLRLVLFKMHNLLWRINNNSCWPPKVVISEDGKST